MAQGSVCTRGLTTRYGFDMPTPINFTISFESLDEEGWIVARILGIPGAMSQGRTREEARENVLDALRTVLAPDEELPREGIEQSQRGELVEREGGQGA